MLNVRPPRGGQNTGFCTRRALPLSVVRAGQQYYVASLHIASEAGAHQHQLQKVHSYHTRHTATNGEVGKCQDMIGSPMQLGSMAVECPDWLLISDH